MNSVLERSESFIRYLKGENIRPFLRILFAVNNFTSVVKDDLNRKELPLLDMGKLYNDRFSCSCPFCQKHLDADTWAHATMDTVTFTRIHSTVIPQVNNTRTELETTHDGSEDGQTSNGGDSGDHPESSAQRTEHRVGHGERN